MAARDLERIPKPNTIGAASAARSGGSDQHLLSWYEAGLPPDERKQRGHFSTPPLLVAQILDACGYTPQRDLSRIRVLDPACGSGNFLVQATRRLLASGIHQGRSPRTLAAQVQRNIWGLDPDPVACFLADLQLRETWSSCLRDNEYPSSYTARLLRDFHIHQADGLTVPWEQRGTFDLFLANPPYLAAKNTDLSWYNPTQSHGQSDSYLLFLRLALQVVRPNGWIALVLPDPVLARANAAKERERLLTEATIHHLWHLADVFTAYVGAVIIVAQKRPPARLHQVRWQRERWPHIVNGIREKTEQTAPVQAASAVNLIPQQLLRQQPRAELRYLLNEQHGTLLARLQTQLLLPSSEQHQIVSLGECVMLRRGEELGKDSQLLCKAQPPLESDNWYPVLRGGVDIRPYAIPLAQCWIERQAITKALERYQIPKLLVVKSAGRLQATLDTQGHVVLQTLYMLHLREDRPALWCSPCNGERRDEDDLYFLLALLNSRFLQAYVYTLYTAYKWVQPQIEQHVLAHLPLPRSDNVQAINSIVQRARVLRDACSVRGPGVEWDAAMQELYEEQERAICLLYAAGLQSATSNRPAGREKVKHV